MRDVPGFAAVCVCVCGFGRTEKGKWHRREETVHHCSTDPDVIME